jgi:hypothetical protein
MIMIIIIGWPGFRPVRLIEIEIVKTTEESFRRKLV